ncbi:MAG TPA: AlpA family phage regulatory protein [Vicinamibacteria bacterium]|nr:AlpA family phage regulatory protein [Vicinamibacteria bacterium]
MPALQLADREQLRVTLQPRMSESVFANWIHRAMRDHAFPQPIRTGKRGCAWLVPEVTAWLQSRPRKGVFAGYRRTTPPVSGEAA